MFSDNFEIDNNQVVSNSNVLVWSDLDQVYYSDTGTEFDKEFAEGMQEAGLCVLENGDA